MPIKTVLVLTILALFLPFQTAFAQSPSPTPPGFTVSPAILKLDLDSDAPQAAISYTNDTSTPVTVTFKAQDFQSLDDGWQVKFLQPKDSQNYSFSLSSWLKFEQDQIEVNPGETQSVKVDINKAELSSGSHYAAIIGQIQQENGNGKVNVIAALSTLLFVRSANGNDIEDGSIDSFDPVRSLLEFPDRFVLRFRNSGNVDLTPYGLIQIYDPFNHQVAKAIINDASFITLPESIRRYDINVIDQNEGHFMWPGRYSATIMTHFGKSNKYLNSETYFWSLGSLSLGEFLGLIALLLVVILGAGKLVKLKRADD